MTRKQALAAAVALAVLPLEGCGFTPLYATPAVTPALASISLDLPGTSRTGYLLKEQLNRTLAHDQSEASQYRLAITLREVRFPGGVRVNNVANRYELDTTAHYVLTDAATGKVLYQSAATTEVSYDSSDPPYAGVVANQDGEQRAAGQLAVLIQLGLARYFEHQATPG